MKKKGLLKWFSVLWMGLMLGLAGCDNAGAENVISIREHHGTVDISMDEVGKYHGHVCVCVVVSYKALQVAIDQLWGEETPERGDFRIESFLATDGAVDTFEMITRVATWDNGRHLILHGEMDESAERTTEDYVFVVTRISTGESATLTLKDGLITEEFLALRNKKHGADSISDEDLKAFKEMKKALKQKLLNIESTDLFEVEFLRND